MKIYRLTAYDVKHNYYLSEYFFTSIKKAQKSKKNLIDYIIGNYYELNSNNIQELKGNVTIIDNTFNVAITEHYLTKYVQTF